MKEEALKLADELQDYMTSLGWKTHPASAMIRRLVEELDNQGEPVAIVNRNKENTIQWLKEPSKWNGYFLYTAPQTKPLSDEQIIEMVKKHFIGAIKLGIVLTHNNVLEFARAIEERHGIK